ncbi:MAG TPA: hypothetical protein VGW74_18880 [Propionibacteriaceae bacterium]|nr:hypothetical protein [Propionibacteriaceae bacterium]
MVNRRDIVALATELTDLNRLVLGDTPTDLEPEHYTTRGYEQLIRDVAAAQRACAHPRPLHTPDTVPR